MKTANDITTASAARRGFSLLEILLVILLIAMASTIVGLQFFEKLDENALHNAARKLLHQAGMARLLAGEQQQPCRLHVDLDKGTFWLTRQTPDPTPATIPGTTPGARPSASTTGRPNADRAFSDVFLRPGTLPKRIRFVRAQRAPDAAVTTGVITIDFYRDGTAQAALIQLGSRDRTVTVLIHPHTARAQISATAVAQLPDDTIDLNQAGRTRDSVFR
ncbi:MAG: prepilin-type N-terminal cleavage/methylation domain-containing protein [Sedimentisphaerales bacterium]|nr:prepilin-type N-terminal cleavage/methylation domain-containing protein [Sedimentisphaerales bacterium]